MDRAARRFDRHDGKARQPVLYRAADQRPSRPARAVETSRRSPCRKSEGDLRADSGNRTNLPEALPPSAGVYLVLHDNLDKRAFYAAFRKATNSVLVAAKRCAFSSRSFMS